MDYREVEADREFLARLETGGDWRGQLEAVAAEEEITAGAFTGLGAVSDARLLYYDQDDTEYQPIEFDEHLEVAACVGNLSMLDGEPFAHTHVVLSRADGSTVAGHLDRATVFAGEIHLRTFADRFERAHDPITDLDLWPL